MAWNLTTHDRNVQAWKDNIKEVERSLNHARKAGLRGKASDLEGDLIKLRESLRHAERMRNEFIRTGK